MSAAAALRAARAAALRAARAAALRAARAAGVAVGVDGDDLVLQASTPPPALLDALSRHRPAIIALLRSAHDGGSVEDWRVFFDGRASIAGCEGGLPRAKTEAGAFACCVAEWLNRNPARSAPGRCLGCGDGDRPGDPLLPFGTGISGHAWLHAVCWPAWYQARRAEAAVALARLGVQEPADSPNDFGKNGGE